MAYGSTLLVILLGVGALDYMGVFNLGDLLPDKCTFAGNVVGCDEFVVYSNLVGLELSNKSLSARIFGCIFNLHFVNTLFINLGYPYFMIDLSRNH